MKNVGVGCVTKCGRASLHLAKKPQIDPNRCDDCGKCVAFCAVGALANQTQSLGKTEKCVLGRACWEMFPQKAISGWSLIYHETNTGLSIRTADATSAIINHISKDKVMFQVTP